MNKIEKIELLKAVINGDRGKIERFKKQYEEKLQGKTIFAEFLPNGTITVVAPCFNWIHDQAKTVNRKEYEKILAKYQFDPMEIPLNDEL